MAHSCVVMCLSLSSSQEFLKGLFPSPVFVKEYRFQGNEGLNKRTRFRTDPLQSRESENPSRRWTARTRTHDADCRCQATAVRLWWPSTTPSSRHFLPAISHIRGLNCLLPHKQGRAAREVKKSLSSLDLSIDPFDAKAVSLERRNRPFKLVALRMVNFEVQTFNNHERCIPCRRTASTTDQLASWNPQLLALPL